MTDSRRTIENSVPALPHNEPSGNPRRDLLMGIGAFVLIALVSFGVLMVGNPGGLGLALLGIAEGPSGENPIDITLVHSNDTWGYLFVCGG